MMPNEQTAIALLLFRIGPVLCCAPADPVQSIISPPKLTHPPGSSDAKPGIFYHADHVISVSDLRHRFGVDESEREQPGRLIITLQAEAFTAYWVDEIIEVIDTPADGWSEPPSHLPKGVFSKTLLLDEKIYLFADFANFENLPDSGYLSQYIQRLTGGDLTKQEAAEEITAAEDISVAETANTTPTADEVRADTHTQPITDTIHNDVKPTAELATSNTDDTKTESPAQRVQTSATEVIVTPEETQTITTKSQSTQSQSETTDLTPEVDNEETKLPQISDEPAPEPLLIQNETDTIDVSSQATPAPQTDTSPEIVEHVIDTAPGTEEVEEDGTDAIDEMPVTEIEHSIEEAEQEAVLTPAQKAARLKSGYLDPVPAVVPETEREPEKPPFPWQNLAAAIVLFITVAGIGIYYSWSTSDKAATRVAKKDTAKEPEQPDVSHKAMARIPQPAPKQASEQKTIPASTSEIEQVNNSGRNDLPDDVSGDDATKDYRAEITPDEQGVTIILHSPANEPVLKTYQDETVPATQRDKLKDDSPQQKTKTNNANKDEIIHIVVKGDTLWDIAEHYVNNPYKYPRLAKLSKIKNPDRIYPGNRVKILRRNHKTE